MARVQEQEAAEAVTGVEIEHVQGRVGTLVDGFWGRKSTAAARRHLRRLMPSPNPWPGQTQAALQAFYGEPGTVPVAKVEFRWPVYLYGSGRLLTHASVHAKLAESLARVYELLEEAFPTQTARVSAGLTAWYGIYNNRSMRGGSLPSLHARAAAEDWDAGRNCNRCHWPVASKMPIEVMECYAKEGWTSAGAFWSRDGMHHQATRP